MDDVLTGYNASLGLLMGFFAITFLQSAVDKIMDRAGNLEFLTSHFSKSPFAGTVGLMLSVLAIVELASGLLCLGAGFGIVFFQLTRPVIWALSLVGVNLLMLLLGQRLAKDYAGASTIGIYFGLMLMGFVII